MCLFRLGVECTTGKALELDWTNSEDVHPFWFTKRAGKNDDAANMEMIYDSVVHVIACPFEALVKAKAKVLSQTYTFTVSYPCLVNTVPMLAGKEAILNWKPENARGNRKAHQMKRPSTTLPRRIGSRERLKRQEH